MSFSNIDRMRIEEYRKHLEPILSLLREPNSVWHRTSVQNLKSILLQGLLPNLGDREATYSQSKTCLGFHRKSICLFDFETFSLEHILSSALDWASLLTDQGAATVLIRIDRTKLNLDFLTLPGSLTHNEMLIPGKPGQPAYIPTHFYAVEAWYKGLLPSESFAELIVIRQHSNYEFVRIPISTTAYEKVVKLSNQWEATAKKEAQERKLRGEFSLADIWEKPQTILDKGT